MHFSFNELNSLHLDVLKEIGTIGAGNAATSLSKLLNKRIDMNVPEIKIAEFKEIENILGSADTIVTGVYLEFSGKIKGNALFWLDTISAKNLVSLLLGTERYDESKEKPCTDFTELEVSAIEEIGNILISSYLNAISSFTGLSVKPTVPYFACDMLGAILSVPLIQYGQTSDKALFIETEFVNGCDRVKSHFIVIPDIESYTIILESLGVI